MRFWPFRVPRTLFGRNLLLMGALIVFAEVGMGLMFHLGVQKPRFDHMVDVAYTHAFAVRSALETMSPEQRQRYLSRLTSESAVHVMKGRAPMDLSTAQGSLVRAFVERFAERLGPAYRLAWQNEPDQRLWINMRIDDEDYWFGITATAFVSNMVYLFLAIALATGLVALFGAYLIQRRINRPLQALATAAVSVGSGRSLPLSLHDAPLEIVQVTASFNQMAADLESAEQERALMLAGVSHDLRTPLAKLRLAVEILATDNVPDPDLVAGMARNIVVADAIIGQFIDFARFGGDEPQCLCDINEMARDVAATSGGKDRIMLALSDLPPLQCRPVALRCAIANLIDNALRYASTGGETIVLRTAFERSEIHLAIIDCGVGIPEKELARCRRPFTRLERSRGGKPGAGLGLAIVERIAHIHCGELVLKNRNGGGLEAVLVLPVL